MAKNVDLGFFNGDFEPWDLEKEYEEYEVESRYFPSKVRLHIYYGFRDRAVELDSQPYGSGS